MPILNFVLLHNLSNSFFFAEHSFAFIKETDPEMAKRLTSAALKVARILAEVNAKTMKKPFVSKVFLSEPLFTSPWYLFDF